MLYKQLKCRGYIMSVMATQTEIQKNRRETEKPTEG